jgi:hypothetical protein
MLADLFERIRATASGARDPEAEAFLAEAVRAQPYAPYVLAQTALVQQHALEAASQRIAELESRAAAPAQETSFLGNLGRSLFGGAAPAAASAARPGYDASAYQRGAPDPAYRQPAYAPPPPPPPAGPWGAPSAAPASGGFLASALTTATGVAGGMVLANTLESLIGGRGGLFGGHSASMFGGGETVNNFYESAPGGGEPGSRDYAAGQDSVQDAGYDAGSDDGGFDSGGFDSGSYDT